MTSISGELLDAITHTHPVPAEICAQMGVRGALRIARYTL